VPIRLGGFRASVLSAWRCREAQLRAAVGRRRVADCQELPVGHRLQPVAFFLRGVGAHLDLVVALGPADQFCGTSS